MGNLGRGEWTLVASAKKEETVVKGSKWLMLVTSSTIQQGRLQVGGPPITREREGGTWRRNPPTRTGKGPFWGGSHNLEGKTKDELGSSGGYRIDRLLSADAEIFLNKGVKEDATQGGKVNEENWETLGSHEGESSSWVFYPEGVIPKGIKGREGVKDTRSLAKALSDGWGGCVGAAVQHGRARTYP